METRYKIVTEGELRKGFDPEQFVNTFSRTFKTSEAQARKLLTAQRTVTLKNNLDRVTAEKFQHVLSEQMGLKVRVEPKLELDATTDGTVADASHTTGTATSNTSRRCPKCGSERVVGDDCLACGVIIPRYLARQAKTAQATPPVYSSPNSKVLPDKESLDGDGEPNLRIVAAGQGWQWIVGGWQLFVRNPGAWIGALIVMSLIGMIAGRIPIVGAYGVDLFSLVFVAGLMLGARAQQLNSDFRVGYLFKGFSTEFSKLMQAGLLYLIGSALTGYIGYSLSKGTEVNALLHNILYTSIHPSSHAGSMLMKLLILFVFLVLGLAPVNGHLDVHSVMGSIEVIMVVLMFLAVLMWMAFFFVPMLVVFDKLAIIEAIKLSFTAISKNAMPFLVYSLVSLGLGILAAIPLGLGFLVLAPVMMATAYVCYRDIFHGGR